MTRATTMFNRWRAADQEAHKVERALTVAWLAALDGRGAPPSEEQREHARRLHEAADALFHLAMAEFEMERSQSAQKPTATAQPVK